MRRGDIITFAGDFSRETWVYHLRAWLGLKVPPRRLQMYEVTGVLFEGQYVSAVTDYEAIPVTRIMR